MADVIMPQMGESIAEGTVTKWLKNVGDRVERDEPLFEISTDKVDAEIPSPAAGVLREIRVAPGTTVPINTVVALIAAEGEAAAAAAEPAAPAPAAAGAPAPATAAAPESAPAPPNPPAAAPAPPQPPAPPVAYQIEGEAPADLSPQPTTEPSGDPEKPRSGMTADELRLTRSSPVVRKIAAEHHVDIRDIPGTGIGGRVTKQDILGHLEPQPGSEAASAAPAEPSAALHASQADGSVGGQQPPPTPVPPPATPQARTGPAAATAPPPAPVPAAAASAAAAQAAQTAARGRVEVVPMSPIRRKTAEHMVLSKRTSAHVSTVFEIDMTRIDQLRHKHRAAFEQHGVKLTYMPFILKAVVDALKAFPVLNASIDGESVVYHKDVNLGVAVALDWGLIVPVVHGADEKNVLGLARSVADLAERARAKKLKVDEVQGGTFTITNPGVFGGLFGTPIINQPQAAILCVGSIEKRPVVRDDAIAIRTMSYFALTFDHRLVDGADADRFMAHVKKTLQEFDEAGL